jgi:hypothetical protein
MIGTIIDAIVVALDIPVINVVMIDAALLCHANPVVICSIVNVLVKFAKAIVMIMIVIVIVIIIAIVMRCRFCWNQ